MHKIEVNGEGPHTASTRLQHMAMVREPYSSTGEGKKKLGTQPYDYGGFPGGSVGTESASNA